MSDSVNISLVMLWLEATKKENLVALMRYCNDVNMRAFNYQSPMKDGNKWIVWFYADPTRDKIPTEKEMLEAFKGGN